MKIFVTRMGVVSPAGLNVEENLQALQGCQTGLRYWEDRKRLIGKVQLDDEAILGRLNLTGNHFSRTTLLAMLAAGSCWDGKNKPRMDRAALISGTSVGGLDRMEHFYMRSRLENKPELLEGLSYDNGRTTDRLAHFLGFAGFLDTLSTACSSGANAIMHGGRLIKAGFFDRALVGASDALIRFNIEGFNALKILDAEPCKPFDDDRAGLNLGEGAAFLLLENESSLSETGNTPLCVLSGWNNATDSFHQTASSAKGVGATLSMRGALAHAGLLPGDISYINTHGTGTRNNDLSESMAIKEVFGKNPPPFSSTKGFTGHTLGAAGAIEAVFSVLSLLERAYLPNLNFSRPMAETGWVPETRFRPAEALRHVLSNSFGFGGNCTSLLFSQFD